MHSMSPLEPCPDPGAVGMMAPPESDLAEMHHLIKDIDYLMAPIASERFRGLSFSLDGIPFEAARVQTQEEQLIRIRATLGYLPYTIESADRRAALLSILSSSQSLFNVRFGLDGQNRIVAVGAFASDTLVSPDFLFHPLTLFLQEAQPFIALIGRYLGSR